MTGRLDNVTQHEYNHNRLHASPGYIPVEYEHAHHGVLQPQQQPE